MGSSRIAVKGKEKEAGVYLGHGHTREECVRNIQAIVSMEGEPPSGSGIRFWASFHYDAWIYGLGWDNKDIDTDESYSYIKRVTDIA